MILSTGASNTHGGVLLARKGPIRRYRIILSRPTKQWHILCLFHSRRRNLARRQRRAVGFLRVQCGLAMSLYSRVLLMLQSEYILTLNLILIFLRPRGFD